MKFSKTINKKKFTKVNKMIFPTDFENNTAIQKLENKDKYIKKNCNMDELDKQQNLLKQVIHLQVGIQRKMEQEQSMI